MRASSRSSSRVIVRAGATASLRRNDLPDLISLDASTNAITAPHPVSGRRLWFPVPTSTQPIDDVLALIPAQLKSKVLLIADFDDVLVARNTKLRKAF